MELFCSAFSYKFSPSGIYCMPEDTVQEGCISYIQTMPLIAKPELFGLHENAEITKEMKETQEVSFSYLYMYVYVFFIALHILKYDLLLVSMQFLTGALETQPSVGGMGAGGASLQVLQEITTDVLEKLPPGFNLKFVGEKYPFDYSNSMNTVLRQVFK